ncbi:hypothetical protein AWB82_06238 [Caballeronia glebae]|uniref:Uncharacterized protein n=1 Tax=Caballeronia glebae TaxID=1777143 RepID=A0A158D4R4_9BURK|nr:hypothetical protein [Caballeronia glebae]SAK89196.1 hypothetical protein AWB82_06238 [Caballeronia glebae]
MIESSNGLSATISRGPTSPYEYEMNLIVVSFEDFTKDPGGARADSVPSAGFPDSWIDALVGTGSVFSRDDAAPGTVKTIGLRFPSGDHAEQFCASVRKVANLLGTRAHIHKVPADQVTLTLSEAARHRAGYRPPTSRRSAMPSEDLTTNLFGLL